MVVPRRAVSELQGLFRVFVVGSDNKIEVRDVKTGPVIENMIVIEAGLDGSETVVVEGLQKVRSGMVVTPNPVVTTEQPASTPQT